MSRPKVEVSDRPFVLTFPATGTSYPITADEVRRYLDEYPIVSVTRYRLVLRADDRQKCSFVPATLGGGPAFIVTKTP